MRVDDGLRIDDIAERFRHSSPMLVEHPPMCRDLPIRRVVPQADAHQERTVKPASVLVVALNVEVGWPRQPGIFAENCQVARAGVEPNVQDVALLSEFGPATVLTLSSCRQKFRR